MWSALASAEISLLMWALAALIVWTASHVLLGWMRQAQNEWEWDFTKLRHVMLGAATFGTALSVAVPLGLAGEALSFPVGYHPWWALALWLGGIAVITLLAIVPVWREDIVTAAGAGVFLGLVMSALQGGWLMAVGFRPGLQWNVVFIVAAGLVAGAGCGTAMALAFPYGERARDYRYSWRITAAGLIGLAFLASFALMLYAADLPLQVGSIYRHELPGSVISLLGGALMPIVLVLMVLDLEARRRQRRRRARHQRQGGESAFAESMMMPMEPPAYRGRGGGASYGSGRVPSGRYVPPVDLEAPVEPRPPREA
jgi:hypothetical protein